MEQHLRCVRPTAGALVRTHPWKSGVRERSRAAVVAIEREGKIIVDFAATFASRPRTS